MIFNPEKQYKDVCAWLKKDDNRKLLFDTPNQKISELLSGDLTAESVAQCASQLGHLSVWWKNEFLKALWEGSDNASCYGALMLDYKFWRLRILSESFDLLLKEDPSRQSPIIDLDVCPLMGLLLSCGRIDQAKWIAKKLLNSSQNPSTKQWLSETDYSRYVFNLSMILATNSGDNSTNDVVIFDCGVYNGLFSEWLDEESLKNVIINVCDEYLVRTNEKNEKKLGILEFTGRPYNVLPVTVMAYQVLRRELGLMTELPVHAILDSKFLSSLPPSIPSIQDDVLSKVVTAASDVFPGILSDS
jgi:hypothetical protein